MLLIIPEIKIKDGKCLTEIQGVSRCICSEDPLEVVKLWRKENAKTLHVTGIFDSPEGKRLNYLAIKSMTGAVDIPIELSSGICSYEEIKEAFELDVYRVILEAASMDNESEIKKAVSDFGSIRLAIKINCGENQNMLTSPDEIVIRAKALGIKRAIFAGNNIDELKSFSQRNNIKTTALYDVSGLNDLLRLQELKCFGVDSVVIGDALYENRFSCQKIWRICETGNYPYTARI